MPQMDNRPTSNCKAIHHNMHNIPSVNYIPMIKNNINIGSVQLNTPAGRGGFQPTPKLPFGDDG